MSFMLSSTIHLTVSKTTLSVGLTQPRATSIHLERHLIYHEERDGRAIVIFLRGFRPCLGIEKVRWCIRVASCVEDFPTSYV